MHFIFEEYNWQGECTLRWEGLAENMADYFEKYSLLLLNRNKSTAWIFASVAFN